MRRSHHRLGRPALSMDAETGELHRRHHVAPDGYYRGREIVPPPPEPEDDEAQV